MRDAIAKVREFHAALGQGINSPEGIRADQQLRVALIEEEADELVAALQANDTIAAADALADLAYVIIGAAVLWGIPLAEVFDEVHRSNMSKVGGGKREDGKILKGPNYSPPDIASILREVTP